jgi:putative endonuclease
MYYVYVLRSTVDKRFCVGYTSDLKRRIEKHNAGLVAATQRRRPLELVYYEVSLNREDAWGREKYLRTSWGKRFIKNRLRNYLTG